MLYMNCIPLLLTDKQWDVSNEKRIKKISYMIILIDKYFVVFLRLVFSKKIHSSIARFCVVILQMCYNFYMFSLKLFSIVQ